MTSATPIRNWDALPDLMSRTELAEFTGIAVQTYARWTSEGLGQGPQALRLGGAVRYTKEAVREWIQSAAA